jgi:two-component system, chemotaxis family, sensor kinase CheA
MSDQMTSVFFDEANELLDNLEGNLLALEKEPANQELVGAVFRAMHTIKGSAGMFGYNDVASFTHELENAFDLVRNGKLPVTGDLINLTLQARDLVRNMLETGMTPELRAGTEQLVQSLHSYISAYIPDEPEKLQGKNTIPVPAENQTGVPSIPGEKFTWRIIFRPSPCIMQNGTRPELLVKELAEMGTATVLAFTDTVVMLSELDPERCYLAWDIILTTDRTENDIHDVFIFLDPDSKITVEKINDTGADWTKIGQILIDRRNITREALEDIIREQKKIGEILVDHKVVTQAEVDSALAEQNHLKKIVSMQQKNAAIAGTAEQATGQTIRVNSEKLDQLIDLVGEMVTFNARLGQIAQKSQTSQLTSLSELSERLVFGLRDTAMEMRMLPIGTIFSRYRRLVHDLANQLNKNIELVTDGGDTELDKTVIEKLSDPLVHLIRNSADHGIELPAVRKAAGKSETGIITLSAKHAGGFVLVSISDDGGGLNEEAIRNKALEKGLIRPTDELNDQSLYELIFLPGFSTSNSVTSVSGRGVGMDVVRKDISSLGGTVTVETKPGKGSKFILTIPLTLAIIDGMLVRIGSQMFVIPLSNIQECMKFENAQDIETLCPHITSRGIYLPCINMHKYFGMEGTVSGKRQVVIVNDQDSRIGIIVESIIGNHQTVIKPIGELYKYNAGISGATILGDGSVALILDILKLSQIIRKLDRKEK